MKIQLKIITPDKALTKKWTPQKQIPHFGKYLIKYEEII